MAYLGGLECAAGVWLRRLRDDDRLPPKGALQALWRREASQRDHAEAVAHAERRRADLASECLNDERRSTAFREELVAALREELLREKRARLEAESALAKSERRALRAEERLAAEVESRHAAERVSKSAFRKIEELKALIADDSTLDIIDKLKFKVEAQRSELNTLQRHSESLQGSCADALAASRRAQQALSFARHQWAGDRQTLVRSRDQAVSRLSRVEEAAAALHSAADQILQLCASVVSSASLAAAGDDEAFPRADSVLLDAQNTADTVSPPQTVEEENNALRAAVDEVTAALDSLVAHVAMSHAM